MEERICYYCPRKAECYTESGLAKLTPADGPADCGALFLDLDGAEEFIRAIGSALREIPRKHQLDIWERVAAEYGASTYFVVMELYK